MGFRLGKLYLHVIGLASLHRKGRGSEIAEETPAEAAGRHFFLLGDGFPVYGELVNAAAAYGVKHVTRVVGGKTAAVAGREAGEVEPFRPGTVLMRQCRRGGVQRERLVVIHRRNHVAAAVQAVVIIGMEALPVIHTPDVAGSDGRIHQVAGAFVKDVGARSGFANGLQNGLGIGSRGVTVVVAQQHAGVIGIGAHHRDGDVFLPQRQNVVLVLQEHDGLPGGFGGQDGVGVAAQLFLAQLGPGKLFGRVEHSQLEAGFQDTAQVHVYFGFGNKSLLNGLGEGFEAGAAFHVGAGKHRIGRCRGGIGVGTMLTGIIEVADGAAVRHHQTAETPFVAEDVGQEPVAAAARVPFIALVGAHHLLHVAVLHNLAEGGQVSLPQVPHGYGNVETVPVGLGAAVYGKMLGAGVQLEVFLVRALHAQHGLGAHDGVQVRVFAGGFLAAPPAGITKNVHVGAPESEAVVPDVTVGFRNAQLVMIRSVPHGAGLIGDGGINLVLLGSVEGGAQGNYLREYRHVVVADAVASFVPPVVGRNIQPVHRDGPVHHQADFLFRSEQGQEIVYPLVQGKTGILERIVVVLAPGSDQG